MATRSWVDHGRRGCIFLSCVSCMGEVSRVFVRVSFFVRVALFELLVGVVCAG